jgi:hypothetical protein
VRGARGILAGLIAAAALAATGSAATAANLVADYRFDGTLLSSVGRAGSLSNAGSGNALAREGDCGTLQFPQGNGLSVPTGGLVPADRYTVVVRFRFDTVEGYRRILNFDANTLDDDNGLYVDDKYVDFYDDGANKSSGEVLEANQYAQVAFTRSAAKQVVVYVNGNQEIVYDDADDVSLLDNGPLMLFRDNTAGGGTGEESAGAVERIRIYDDALPAAQIPAGNACTPAPRCGGARASMVGSQLADVLVGTPGRDVIAGLGGNDALRGLGGNDVLCGGAGKDRLIAGAGRDSLLGGGGNDRLLGGAGRDRLLGGAGKDRLIGAKGRDTCRGGPGRDLRGGCERGRG